MRVAARVSKGFTEGSFRGFFYTVPIKAFG